MKQKKPSPCIKIDVLLIPVLRWTQGAAGLSCLKPGLGALEPLPRRLHFLLFAGPVQRGLGASTEVAVLLSLWAPLLSRSPGAAARPLERVG